MVLNALEVDPKRRWKGNWRWFSGNIKNNNIVDGTKKVN